MNSSKVLFIIFLIIISLLAINVKSGKSQVTGVITILSNGDISPSSMDGDYIQKEGDIYTFLYDLPGASLIVQRSGITIDGAGFALSGEGEAVSAIDVSYRSDVIIRDVVIQGIYNNGINILESNRITVIDNTISSTRFGIFLVNSTQNTISENNIVNNEVGLFLISSPGNTFSNNNLNNQNNLAVFGNEFADFVNDIDVSNTVVDKKTYYLINKENIVITPETYPDVGFLALIGCTNITVQNIELTKNGQGIILAYTTESTILQNNITNNENGILLFGSTNNVITGNSITKNGRGIQLSKSSTGNDITANLIKENQNGILFFDSTTNTLISNNITGSNIGIGFTSSSNNMIRGNFFIDNTQQVYDPGDDDSTIRASVNYWDLDYPIGGNYWSNYPGFDLKSGANQDQEGSDDIGDTPHIINDANKDNYPKMFYGNPFIISIVSPENKTYITSSVSVTYVVTESDSIISYSLDGQANKTLIESMTLSDLSYGSHELMVYAKDAEGNESSDMIYFTISKEGEPPSGNGDSEDFPITLIAVVGLVAVVGVVLLYFFKIKKK
ncbi:MAG: right-handed parallel beta-helix repeat-containing protein [Desulfobacterales bacterium]|nr:right-handed parallel beta-helix repeat-containing protein [Desulfobacterales bacterium]